MWIVNQKSSQDNWKLFRWWK